MKNWMIGLGLAAAMTAVASPQAASAACTFTRLAELKVTMSGLRPTVMTKIDGKDAVFIVDSGAFYSTISAEGAQRLGLKTELGPDGMIVKGVGGRAAKIAQTKVKEFNLGDARVRNVEFLIAGEDFGGDADGLLGQNILGVYDVEYDFANGALRIFEPKDCGDRALIYWLQPNQAFSSVRIAQITPLDPHVNAGARVNGQSIRAVLDTGASRSTLTLKAAAKAGVTPTSDGAVPGGQTGGIGRRTVETWIAPFQSFGIGDEEIRNTRLRIGDTGLEDADMLLGADFFASHRVMVATSQQRLYFTYNGGPVFRFDQAGGAQVARAEDEPKDASGFHRRGTAFAARRDYDRAIEDFSRAVKLEPGDAEHLFQRALAQLATGKIELGWKDLDAALALKPDHVRALMTRGRLELNNKQEAKAERDFDEALRVSQDNDISVEIGDAYTRIKAFDTAIGFFDRWITANPKSNSLPMILNARCWARALAGKDLDKALADCDQALKLQPRTSSILDSRGFVRLKLGQFTAAIADYDAVLKLQPRDAWSMYCRGLAKQRAGQKDAGDADIKAALALEPSVAERAKDHGALS